MRVPALVLLTASLVACGPQQTAGTPPANVESVGAPDHFGRGIVRLGDAGDRILVDVSRPSYWTLVRFDSLGTPIAAAAMDTRRSPGITWLEIPAGQNASRGTASVANPACAETHRNARQDCARRPRVIETGPALLRSGEVIILFVTTEPFRPAALEDRLSQLPDRPTLLRVPAMVMAGREDVWAAYLVRR